MKKLLLHSCCAPCSTAVIEKLLADMPDFEILVYYYNPNIFPEAEYQKRKNEQIKYIELLNNERVKFVDADYVQTDYFNAVSGLEDEKEGGNRCTKCFYLRLLETCFKAQDEKADMFGTTLTVSPHKNAELINAIGLQISSMFGVEFLVADFKKQDGYKRSVTLSKENNIYRQNYCGCKFSIWDGAILPEE